MTSKSASGVEVSILNLRVGMHHAFGGVITSVTWGDEGITVTFDDLKGRWTFPYKGDVQRVTIINNK